ncbi:MAG: type I-F CRISPR-associated endoribonuclease Cas6/Csy4 [Gammaproteobacteria bacterium]|nr:MAG: type I-F CRISPR-associated endoribonuclease Cas6/Csy4 [Gammaproteobacteria bacterium]
MNHYLEIKIIPDAEMRESVLLNKVYIKLHKALFDLKNNRIGVSFPEYRIKLGKLIRIHGDQAILNDLQGLNWLGGLGGYCKVSDITKVPEKCKYRIISRKQANMTEAKLRRLIKRGSIKPDEVNAYKAKMFSQGLDHAFLELDSGSNGHYHRRFIQFGDLIEQPIKGEFDFFGLSKQATVPWF